MHRRTQGPGKLGAEPVDDLCRGGLWAAGIVVEQYEGDAVPILGLATRVRGCDLRQEVSGKSGDEDLDSSLHITVGRPQGVRLGITRCDPGPSEVSGTELVAVVEGESGTRGLVVEVGENLITVPMALVTVVQRQTRSGSKFALRRARSSLAVLTAPPAISRLTCTSMSVVPAWRVSIAAHSSCGTRPPMRTNSGFKP